jgi:hypothetical protein
MHRHVRPNLDSEVNSRKKAAKGTEIGTYAETPLHPVGKDEGLSCTYNAFFLSLLRLFTAHPFPVSD